MPEAAIDYDLLARQHGGLPLIDYESLAREHGGEPLDSKPVHHSSNDVEELRQSAERQAPKIGDAVRASTEGVPGAKLEAVRDSKDTDRIEDKAERQGVQPSQIADVTAAKVTVPHQAAAEKVLTNLHKDMPVESANGSVTGEPGKNSVRQVQAVVKTGEPSEPVKKAEVLIQTPEMHAATEQSHDEYRQAQELRAAGKDAEATKLEQKIMREHDAAEQAARSRQGEPNVQQSTEAPRQEEESRTALPSNRDETPAPSPKASGQEKEEGSAGGVRSAADVERKPGQAPIPLQRNSNERPQVQEAAKAGTPIPAEGKEEAAAENQGVGLSRQAGAAPIPPTKLRELQAKLSTSVTPEDNLKGQRVQVRTETGDWRGGTVLADSVTGGPDRLRRLRGSFDDGTKFDNVKISDVKKDASPDVAVDFDGTLAKETGSDKLGEALPERIKSIQKMLDAGKSVVIFTRRVEKDPTQVKPIQDWLEKNGLPRLPVTDIKEAKEFYDNTAHHAPTDANTPLIKSNNARKQ